MEWKFKVGDVIEDGVGCKFTVIGTCLEFDVDTYILINNSNGVVIKSRKYVAEEISTLVKQKSLYEQALDLLNLKIGDEFEVNMFSKGNHWVVFKVLEDRFESLCDFGCLHYHVDLDSLLKNPSNIRNIVTPNVKSEAELILDELKVAMNKANKMLERNGR